MSQPTLNHTESPPLPAGWRWVTLDAVVQLNPRRPRDLVRDDAAMTSFVPMDAVDQVTGSIAKRLVRPYGQIKKGYTYFADGDVLFAKITPCMQNGKHAVARNLMDGLGFGTTEFHVLRPGPPVTSEWLHFFVRQRTVLYAATQYLTGAVGQQRLPEDYLARLALPLPPVAEQQRIAALLAEQLAAVEKARQAAETQLAAVNALPSSLLREFFPPLDSPLPAGWRWEKLGPFIAQTRNGFGGRPKGQEAGRIVLRIADVSGGAISLARTREVAMAPQDERTYALEPGDLLFIRVNGSAEIVGRCVAVERCHKACCFSDHLIRLRLRDGLLPHYLRVATDAPSVRRQLVGSASTTAGQLTINRDSLDSLVLPLPPVAEQQRIAAQLQEQFAAVDQARQAAEAQLDAINALPAALLRQAFRG